MSYKHRDLLSHIRDELNFLMKVFEQYTYTSFSENELATRAVERSFEIIGEATNKLDDSFKSANNNIPWRTMVSMRNRLIHDYMDVDYEVVWDTLQNDIPELKIKIDKLLN